MPCSAISLDGSEGRRGSLAPLGTVRSMSQLQPENTHLFAGSPIRTPSLRHYAFPPDQDGSHVLDWEVESGRAKALPNIPTNIHSPSLNVECSTLVDSTSLHPGYCDTQHIPDSQHILYPHPPDAHDQDSLPSSAPPAASGNKQARHKHRKKKEKSRNRKKRTRAGASGKKGSTDTRTAGRVLDGVHPTLGRETTWHAPHPKHGDEQGRHNHMFFEECDQDTRRLRVMNQCALTGHSPPLLTRSTTSIAFSGPGYVLSPAGGGVLSPRHIIHRYTPGDSTLCEYRTTEDIGHLRVLTDSVTKLPNIPSGNSKDFPIEHDHIQLKESSSDPEIGFIQHENQHLAEEAHVTNSTMTSNMTSSNQDIQHAQHAHERQNSDVTRRTSTVVQNNSDPSDADKKRRPVALLVAIKPENQEAEREKFFKLKYNYEPQFTYRFPPNPGALEKFARPTNRLLNVAMKIMNHVINRFGSYESFVARTGGKKLNRSQIVEAIKKYLKKEKMLDEVSIRLSDDMLSRACMTRIRGQPTLQVRINDIHEFWMDGLLRHEIGTHYIRSSNNRCQEWHKWRRRRDLKLRPFNPTEEGIAALHSIIRRPEPSMFRSALLYYTVYKASELSFSELFKDLNRYVVDPQVRWDYCMRAKRGQIDTSQPGTFSKDQVYLTGAMSILKHREHIDFHALFRCGKVDFRDVDRIKEMADLETTRIPGFMVDLELYKRHLEDIVIKNGLTDDDLSAAV